jgi:hypothetical protein
MFPDFQLNKETNEQRLLLVRFTFLRGIDQIDPKMH